MSETQTYQTHRQWVPLWHFVALPIALANLIIAGMGLKQGFSFSTIWVVVFAIGFAAAAYLARQQAIVVQNRLIRLEERLRMRDVLSEGLRGRIGELNTSQLIGLRFAPDAELAGLVERCLSGQLADAEAVKKEIKGWRSDTLRA